MVDAGIRSRPPATGDGMRKVLIKLPGNLGLRPSGLQSEMRTSVESVLLYTRTSPVRRMRPMVPSARHMKGRWVVPGPLKMVNAGGGWTTKVPS